MSVATKSVSDSAAFDLWATVYDSQPNPLLSLEERLLTPMLPGRADRILDIGCGTGRWLPRLEQLQPDELTGIDPSPQMLQQARAKSDPSTRLYLSDSRRLPSEDDSLQLVLASFVVSYLEDLNGFATECQRVMQPGGTLVLSDMHPETAMRKQWERSFHAEGRQVALEVNLVPLSQVLDTFANHDFQLEKLVEPPFGSPERTIFEQAGRLHAYVELDGVPAIYIAKFRKAIRPLRFTAACADSTTDEWNHATVSLPLSSIEASASPSRTMGEMPGFTGLSILPGFINAHDHLEFGLFPRLGRDPHSQPYQNATEWAHEIQQDHRQCIDLHRQVPLEARLWWAAIRNILCGVTTVCHHNPMHPEFDHPDYPVHVIQKFGWSHSLAFESLQPGERLDDRYAATPHDEPFILHAGEGVDQTSQEELCELDRRRVLSHRTVLVHGLAFNEAHLSLLNQRGAALIVCPTSNHFLFHRSLSRHSLASIQRLALGSDSPITAAGDFLDEVQYLRNQAGLSEQLIYQMATVNAADVLRMAPYATAINARTSADVVAMRTDAATPSAAFCNAGFEQIELVIRAGKVRLSSSRLYANLPPYLQAGMECMEIAGCQRWIRAPLHKLFTAAETVLGRGNLRLSGRPIHCVGSL